MVADEHNEVEQNFVVNIILTPSDIYASLVYKLHQSIRENVVHFIK